MTSSVTERLAGCVKRFVVIDGGGYLHAEFDHYAAAVVWLRRLGYGYHIVRVSRGG